MPDLNPCDTEIYKNGEFVGILHDIHGPENIEAEVLKVRQLGFMVDWHYAAGRGIIKTLSDVNLVRNAFEANNLRLYVGD
jgi:hypothetical protein